MDTVLHMLVSFDSYSGLILLFLHTSCLVLLKIIFDKITLFQILFLYFKSGVT